MPEIAEVAAGSFKQKNPPAIAGAGYVVKSLEAALWAFYRSNTFEKGALLAVTSVTMRTPQRLFLDNWRALSMVQRNPESWLERLSMHDFIGEMADALLNLCEHLSR